MTDLKVKTITLEKLMPSIMNNSTLTRDDFRREAGSTWINETGILFVSGSDDIFQRTVVYLGPTPAEEATIRAKYRKLQTENKELTFAAISDFKTEEVIEPKPKKEKLRDETVNFEDLSTKERIYHIVTSERDGFALDFREEYAREMPPFMETIAKDSAFKRIWDHRLSHFSELMVARIKKKREGLPVLYIPLVALDGREIVYGKDNVRPNPFEEKEPEAKKGENNIEDFVQNLRISVTMSSSVEALPRTSSAISLNQSQKFDPPEEGDPNTTFTVYSSQANRDRRSRFFVVPEIVAPEESSSPNAPQPTVHTTENAASVAPNSSHAVAQPRLAQETQCLRADAPATPQVSAIYPEPPIVNPRNECWPEVGQSQRLDANTDVATTNGVVSQADGRPADAVAPRCQTATARSWNRRPDATSGQSRSIVLIPRSRDGTSLPPPAAPPQEEATNLRLASRRAASEAPRPPPIDLLTPGPLSVQSVPSEEQMQTVWEAPQEVRHDHFIPSPPPVPIRREVAEENLTERAQVPRPFSQVHFFHESASVDPQPPPIMHRSNEPFIARPPQSVPMPEQQPQPTVPPPPVQRRQSLPPSTRRVQSPERADSRRYANPTAFFHANSVTQAPAVAQRLENPVPTGLNRAIAAPQQKTLSTFPLRPAPRRQSQPPPRRRVRSPESNEALLYFNPSAVVHTGAVSKTPMTVPQRLENTVPTMSDGSFVRPPQQTQPTAVGPPAPRRPSQPQPNRQADNSERNDASRYTERSAFSQTGAVSEPHRVVPQRSENTVPTRSDHPFIRPPQQKQPTVAPASTSRNQSLPPPNHRASSPERNDARRYADPVFFQAGIASLPSVIPRRLGNTVQTMSDRPFIVPQQQPQPTDLSGPDPGRRSRQPLTRRAESNERNDVPLYTNPAASFQANTAPPPPTVPLRLGNTVPAVSTRSSFVPQQQTQPAVAQLVSEPPRTVPQRLGDAVPTRSDGPFIVPQQQTQPNVLPLPAPRRQSLPNRRAESSERNDSRRHAEPTTFYQANTAPPPSGVPRLGNTVPTESYRLSLLPQQQTQPTVHPPPAPRRQSQLPPTSRAPSSEIAPVRTRGDVSQRIVTPSALPSLNLLIECTVEFLALRYPLGATVPELRAMWEEWFRVSFEGKTSESVAIMRREGVVTFNGASFALTNLQRWLEHFPRMEALEEAAVTAFIADYVSDSLRNTNPVHLRNLDMDIPLAKFDSLSALFPDRFVLLSSGVIGLPPDARQVTQ